MPFFALFTLILLWGCAVSPTGSNQAAGARDQDWLIKLATYRVRDETILKSQDKVPLNMEDLRDLLAKELDEKDLLDLVNELGVAPKPLAAELSELTSLGASPSLLHLLGKTKTTSDRLASKPLPPPTVPLITKSIQKQRPKETEEVIKLTVPEKKVIKPVYDENKTNSLSAPLKIKKRAPSSLSSDPKHLIPNLNDPHSKRQ